MPQRGIRCFIRRCASRDVPAPLARLSPSVVRWPVPLWLSLSRQGARLRITPTSRPGSVRRLMPPDAAVYSHGWRFRLVRPCPESDRPTRSTLKTRSDPYCHNVPGVRRTGFMPLSLRHVAYSCLPARILLGSFKDPSMPLPRHRNPVGYAWDTTGLPPGFLWVSTGVLRLSRGTSAGLLRCIALHCVASRCTLLESANSCVHLLSNC